MAMTRRTMLRDRGMMARSPALAAPAPGPNLPKAVAPFARLLYVRNRRNVQTYADFPQSTC
jgi:hypothetical protein